MGDYELCDVCMEGVTLINEFITSQKTFADIKPHAINLCVKVLTKKGYHGDYMCPGIVESYGPGTWFVFVQLSLDPLTVCEKLNYCLPSMGLWKTTGERKVEADYNPHRLVPDRVVPREAGDELSGTEKILRILQLSDIHVDPYYTTGAATDCGLYICCRSQFNGTGSAGQYGNYDCCDIPVRTLDIVLSAIRKLDPAPDFIIYTGDSPPHDVWQESWDSQLKADSLVVQRLNEQLEGFTIYPAIGNHESYPESFYYQPSTAYQALNSKLATLWGSWFNVSADQRESIEISAYYTTLVRPGLRILSFNTDYGYLANFYFLLNDRIPAYREQQQFMKDVLAGARQSNEKVIIIGHVPPGDKGSSVMDYGDFYTDLAVNYSDVIVLHLFGHTHHDEFELVSACFLYLDSEIFLSEGKTDVKLLYSAKDEYGLSDMSPQSWRSLSDR
ncbi:sphingomyelin phosphodiesterase A-like [Liolophura sinensis]|uniref:sphingomyelin phosphodiesterase A-like n=1 Tax=Liolophura sinensis TaxID=3198878 RepID=UPI003158F61C